VAMADKLSRLGVSRGEAKPYQYVVKAPLELSQQVLAGNALLPDGALEVGTELILEDAVDALDLLLFAQLEAVPDDLRPSIVAVLTGRKVSFFNSTGGLEAAFPLEE